ncbi:unnamed protein product, partial [Discosporangium mesarthrocarpum]
MPVTADYTWVESETTVQLQVPLKGTSPSRVDIFATECYLKVSFPPYLLEVDLHGFIDPEVHTARVRGGILIIKLTKKNGYTGLWGKIGVNTNHKSDPGVVARRKQSIQDKLKREQELMALASQRKHDDERLALRCQMSLEEAERQHIEDIKSEEKKEAEEEVYSAFSEMVTRAGEDAGMERESHAVSHKSKLKDDLGSDVEASEYAEEKEVGEHEQIFKHDCTEILSKEVQGEAAPESKDGQGEYLALENTCLDAADGRDDELQNSKDSVDPCNDSLMCYVPGPRKPATIGIGFTARLFPTPLRESKAQEESVWITKNHKHLSKNKALTGKIPPVNLDVDISESDPVWLKGRGDDLYNAGDYLAAINAYTAALEADPSMASSLSNRGASYLRLGQHEKCVADCCAAINAFRSSGGSGPSQARAFARRAMAQAELGQYHLSREDYRAALQFSPGDAGLKASVASAEVLARCEVAKRGAATKFAAGDFKGAHDLYSEVLELEPSFPSCLSNRAACHLALGSHEECVRDCTAALLLLDADPSDAGTSAKVWGGQCGGVVESSARPPVPGSAPPPGSRKRTAWVVSTVMRRGMARIKIGAFNEALEDYRAAGKILPGDKAVESDIEKLEHMVEE